MFYNDNRYNSECYKPLYILYDIISKYIGQNFPKVKKKMDESIVLVGYFNGSLQNYQIKLSKWRRGDTE